MFCHRVTKWKPRQLCSPGARAQLFSLSSSEAGQTEAQEISDGSREWTIRGTICLLSGMRVRRRAARDRPFQRT